MKGEQHREYHAIELASDPVPDFTGVIDDFGDREPFGPAAVVARANRDGAAWLDRTKMRRHCFPPVGRQATCVRVRGQQCEYEP